MSDEMENGAQATEGAAEPKEKKQKKLAKDFDGTVVILTGSALTEDMRFDFAELPADIQAKLGPFGLGHKLGDSAAGKEGQEAVDSIMKVWNGLINGDWAVRAPAKQQVNLNDVRAKIDALPEEQRDKYVGLLESLGIKLPPKK